MWTSVGWQEVVRYDMSFLDSRHVRPVKNPALIERFFVGAITDVGRMLAEAFVVTGGGNNE
jgi:predicted alpha/beta-hydrolase family hydrolase